jgi:hypothetical protein
MTSHYLLTPVQMGQIFDIDESQSMMSKAARLCAPPDGTRRAVGAHAMRPPMNAGEKYLRQLSEEETRA